MKNRTILGIERIDEFKNVFEGKRVGLITNPTGIDGNFKTSIDILREKTNLVGLFSPEHGVRASIQAGVHLDTYVDDETGITVYSLYGKSKKPSKEVMDVLDIMSIDIQDCGSRYYTFIYTMAYCMMACAEYDKEFVVFDRPNPVNASDFEGNILGGELPNKQNQMVRTWILIHKEELESLWRLLQDENDYFKIEPLK